MLRNITHLFANALAIWAQNSTAIPVAMTRLTSETAFNDIFQTTMIPIKLIIMRDIVRATQRPAASPIQIWKIEFKIGLRQTEFVLFSIY